MRWIKKPKPQIDDTRIVTRFLFFPKCIDGECRWLETAQIKQRYDPGQNGYPPLYFMEWVDDCWLKSEE
jgi:hypothetical protein